MIAVGKGIIQLINPCISTDALTWNDAGVNQDHEHKRVISVLKEMFTASDQSHLYIELKDVENILDINGSGLIGLGEASGPDKAIKAVEQATLLTTAQKASLIVPSQALLGIITGNEAEFEVEEFYDITKYLQSMLGEETEIIYGSGKDHNLGDKIRVFVVIPCQ